jgi:DNA-directed RNA polymerase specialized sigma24 family protein
MPCLKKLVLWRRAWRSVLREPRGWLLGGIGATLLTLGVLVGPAAAGVALIGTGCGAVLLGVLLPITAQAEIGTFKFTRAASATEGTFQPFVASMRSQLDRVAMLVCGNKSEGKALVERTLGRAYLDWRNLVAEEREAYVYCTLFSAIERTLPLSEGVVEKSNGDTTPENELILLASLSKLPLRLRAAWVLHAYALLDEDKIAQALSISPQQINQHIQAAKDQLDTLTQHQSAKS